MADKKLEEVKSKDEVDDIKEELEKESRVKNDSEIPKGQEELPRGMHDSKIMTSIRNMSDLIKEKMDQLHDLATMEVMLDTPVRVKNRLDSIKKMTSAQHIKVRGQWKTTAPKMHITRLEAKKINNDEFEISFGVFETDEKGNKKLYTNYSEMTLHNGESIKRPTSAEYRVAYEVVEKIKSGKPITREVIRLKD